MAETRKINLLDIYLSSFLSLHGIEPALELKSGKVVFTFEADDQVYRLMNLFNGNVDVPVADFVTTVKTLRGKMLSAKETRNGNGEWYGQSFIR
ncbi:MAG TPA: DUF5659 domain-containing protein [Syntrophorhabdaceae bacterium]|nr:DUF5659 domain-containing protein [Syntrophorhabdaceae bacterium]